MTSKPRTKIRISVPVTKELDQKIDSIAKKLSLSKSATCAMLLSTATVQKALELEILSVTNINELMKEQIKKIGEKQ